MQQKALLHTKVEPKERSTKIRQILNNVNQQLCQIEFATKATAEHKHTNHPRPSHLLLDGRQLLLLLVFALLGSL